MVFYLKNEFWFAFFVGNILFSFQRLILHWDLRVLFASMLSTTVDHQN